jgi:hypothetical protein
MTFRSIVLAVFICWENKRWEIAVVIDRFSSRQAISSEFRVNLTVDSREIDESGGKQKGSN